MKKIVIPFDGSHFSEGAFEFAVKLNETEPILLAGVFLPEIVYPGNYGFTGSGAIEIPALIPFLEEDSSKIMNAGIRHFKELCVKHGIEHRIHKGEAGFALQQLQKEGRYADLIIIGSQLFYKFNGEDTSVEPYLSVILHRAECPVLLVPEHYEFPENIILAYDGSSASVYAIKQFAYIFPELCRKSTLLVYADKSAKKEMPDAEYIEELAARHFNDLTLLTLEAEPIKYFETWLIDNKNPLIVTGAYDRSAISNLFKKSFAQEIIGDYKIPVFVAHT